MSIIFTRDRVRRIHTSATSKRQTRRHQDVDIILRVSDVAKLSEVLGRRGFVVKDGKPPNSFVLANGLGLEVDVHAVVFDDDGNGVYRMQNGEDWIYPGELEALIEEARTEFHDLHHPSRGS